MNSIATQLTHLRQFAAVGQFVSSFEWCCWRLRHYSASILQAKGLRDFPLAEVIFNQRIFTADPLFSCYASMASHATDRNPEVIAQIESVRPRFTSLVKKRNDLLHGTYMIGVDQDGRATEMLVEKQTPDKYGPRTIAVVSSESEMTELIAECRAVDQGIHNIFTSVWRQIRPATGKHT
jgi:hypothetical protein